jgi:hypothetical protein
MNALTINLQRQRVRPRAEDADLVAHLRRTGHPHAHASSIGLKYRKSPGS